MGESLMEGGTRGAEEAHVMLVARRDVFPKPLLRGLDLLVRQASLGFEGVLRQVAHLVMVFPMFFNVQIKLGVRVAELLHYVFLQRKMLLNELGKLYRGRIGMPRIVLGQPFFRYADKAVENALMLQIHSGYSE